MSAATGARGRGGRPRPAAALPLLLLLAAALLLTHVRRVGVHPVHRASGDGAGARAPAQGAPGTPRRLWMYWAQGLDHLRSLANDTEGKYFADYQCVQAMIRYNPHWDVRVVSDASVAALAPALHSLLQNDTLAPKLAPRMKSNVARLELLRRYGGVYSDTSTCPFIELDRFFEGVDFNELGFFAPPDLWKMGRTPARDLPSSVSWCHDSARVRAEGQEFRSAGNYFLAAARPNNPLVVEWLRVYVDHLRTLSFPRKPYFLAQCSFTQARKNNATVEEIWVAALQRLGKTQHPVCMANKNKDCEEEEDNQRSQSRCGFVKKPQACLPLKNYVTSFEYLKDIDKVLLSGTDLAYSRLLGHKHGHVKIQN